MRKRSDGFRSVGCGLAAAVRLQQPQHLGERRGFQAFLTGPGYDYTKGPDAIAIGDPATVYRAFCNGALSRTTADT
jgi:hypothetical protein